MAKCKNCASQRREIFRSGFCSKCYNWELKRKKLIERIGRAVASDSTSVPNVGTLWRYERILEEYRWRETNLQSKDVTPSDIESLVNAVAMECRSELNLFDSSQLQSLSAKSRKLIFVMLLDLIENIPSKRLRLHTSEKPVQGSYQSGWLHEVRNWWAGSNYRDRLNEIKDELKQ